MCHDGEPIIGPDKDTHGYAAYPHFPLGRGLFACKERCEKSTTYNTTWLLNKDINRPVKKFFLYDSDGSKIYNDGDTFDQCANVGKDEPIRAICIADEEVVGANTLITHQAPQVKLRYVGEGEHAGKFFVYTILHGCKNGDFYLKVVEHKHCLCMCDEAMLLKLNPASGKSKGVPFKDAQEQYIKDLRGAMAKSIKDKKAIVKGELRDDTVSIVDVNLGDNIEDMDIEDDNGVLARVNIEAAGERLLQRAFNDNNEN